MPISVFGSSNDNISNKIDTSSIVQKPYLRTNYIEADIEEDIDMKNQFYIKNLPSPINLDEAISKRYGDTNYLKITDYDNDSIVRNNTHTNFKNNTLIGLNSIYLNQDPEFDLQVSTKQYTDKLFDDESIVKILDIQI